MSNFDGFWRCKGCGQRGAQWFSVRHSMFCEVAKRLDRARTDGAAVQIASQAIRYFGPKNGKQSDRAV